MGFLDKLKEGAEQAKDLAAAAADRAKDEAKELSLKRQIGNETEALGAKVFELAEQGTIANAELEPHVARIRELTAELEAIRSAQTTSDEEAPPPGEPPQSSPPPSS